MTSKNSKFGMKTILSSCSVFIAFSFSVRAFSAIPTASLNRQMDELLAPLESADAYKKFLQENKSKFGEADAGAPLPAVVVESKDVKADGDQYKIGMGFRSVYIEAPPKVVVDIVSDPKYFQDLYGLDKPATLGTPSADGSYEARIFKLVPGIETQDYVLNYKGRWQDGIWIQRAKMVKDEKNFALRDNIKFVEPSGKGSVYRELSLFFPMRWWARLLDKTVRNITRSELMKLNLALKCAAERVHRGQPMSRELAKSCHKESKK